MIVEWFNFSTGGFCKTNWWLKSFKIDKLYLVSLSFRWNVYFVNKMEHLFDSSFDSAAWMTCIHSTIHNEGWDGTGEYAHCLCGGVDSSWLLRKRGCQTFYSTVVNLHTIDHVAQWKRVGLRYHRVEDIRRLHVRIMSWSSKSFFSKRKFFFLKLFLICSLSFFPYIRNLHGFYGDFFSADSEHTLTLHVNLPLKAFSKGNHNPFCISWLKCFHFAFSFFRLLFTNILYL